MDEVGDVTIRLYGDLVTLVRDADRGGEVRIPAAAPRSVKDAVESCGVPHTEIDLLLVNNRSVGFSEPVGPGDRVAVYPPFSDLQVPSKVRPDPLPEPRFVLDVHLGRLAERLRLLGFDTRYSNRMEDADLAAMAAAGPRWLLTRDRGLLMRSVVSHGHLVRADDPEVQSYEVAARFGLQGLMRPFTRCLHCNGLLERVDKAAVADRLLPATRREHTVFSRCCDCGRVYWPGSHHVALRAFVERVSSAAP